MPKTARPLIERIKEKIFKTDSCWLWTGTVSKTTGYGVISLVGKKGVSAHVAVFELLVGKIEKGYVLDHICRIRNCVNPSHLEQVTQLENLLRSQIAPASVNIKKTECINGHEFTKENTYIKPNGNRNCRTCRAQASLRMKERVALCLS